MKKILTVVLLFLSMTIFANEHMPPEPMVNGRSTQLPGQTVNIEQNIMILILMMFFLAIFYIKRKRTV